MATDCLIWDGQLTKIIETTLTVLRKLPDFGLISVKHSQSHTNRQTSTLDREVNYEKGVRIRI